MTKASELPRRRFLTAISLSGLLALIAFQGCAKPSGPPGIDEWKPLLRMAVSLGTDRLLTENPGIAPLMVRTLAIIEDVLDRGTFTSVAQINDLVRQVIPWDKIDPAAKPMVEALITAIGEEVRVLATRYQIPDKEYLLATKDIVSWAKEVAERHQVAPVRLRKLKG